jgi:hypothetical protein
MALSTTKLIVADPNKGIKVDSGIVAKSFRDEIKQKVDDLKKEGIGKTNTKTVIELN